MPDRPIIMSGDSVRAILAGRKTQERRLLRLRPPYVLDERNDGTLWPWDTAWSEGDDCSPWMRCQYGEAGDGLWVRETWATTEQAGDHPSDARVVCRATDPDWATMDGWRWRSPLSMPRWASRLTLTLTDVRVERLQDISEADAVAEGVRCWVCDGPVDGTGHDRPAAHVGRLLR